MLAHVRCACKASRRICSLKSANSKVSSEGAQNYLAACENKQITKHMMNNDVVVHVFGMYRLRRNRWHTMCCSRVHENQ